MRFAEKTSPFWQREYPVYFHRQFCEEPLAGDIEKNSETRLLKRHADKLLTSLLVAPHHGSRSSSSYEFVAATLPDYAVFTAGYRNRFGHPKEEVLQRYADSGAELLRSDEDGAILVEINAQGLQVKRYRKTQRRYWTHTLRQKISFQATK